MRNKSWQFIPLIVALTSLGYFATDIYMPSMPAISHYFGVVDRDTQMTLSAYFLSFCFTPLIFGPYSDSAGRKPVIIGGLLLAMIATLLCITAPNIYWLIGGRFFQGIGCGAVVTSVRAMLPDKFKGAEMSRHTAIIAMSIPIVLSVAPAIGGMLEEAFSWHSTFIFLAIYILALIVWVCAAGEETLQQRKPFTLSHKIYYELFKNKTFVAYGLMGCLVFFGMSGYLAVSSFLFQDTLGLNAETFGFLSFAIAGSSFVGSLINMMCSTRFHSHVMLWIGIASQIIAGMMLLLFEYFEVLSVMNLLWSSMIFFISSSLIFPNALSGAFHSLSQHYGSASAVISAMQIFAGFLAASLLSLLPPQNAVSLGLCFLFVGIFTMGCLIPLRDPQKSPS